MSPLSAPVMAGDHGQHHGDIVTWPGHSALAPHLGLVLMTGLNVTRPDRSLARNSRADRGNNFKVHSHQANPTHDINLRFFTFCKLASSFNVNDNGWNIKTIYSVMC